MEAVRRLNYNRRVNKMINTIWREYFAAKRSLRLSKREINNVCLEARFFYISDKKLEVFLDSIGIGMPIEENKTLTGKLEKNFATVEGTYEKKRKANMKSELKEAIKKAKGNRIVPYEKCTKGDYILVHLPFHNGTLELKGDKTYSNTYWWYGVYRNLKIFACGNCDNIVDGLNMTNVCNTIWNPSATCASKKLFDKIENYVHVETSDLNELSDEYLFSQLSGMIHDGTMRGNVTSQNYGWYDMLLRCDAIETDNGAIKIFGSPVFVTFNTLPGYRWDYIGEDTNYQYYREKRNGKDGDCIMKIGQVAERTYSLNSRIFNKMPYGFGYGYWMYESHGKTNIHIAKDVQCVSVRDVGEKYKAGNGNEHPIEKAVCLTTSIIEGQIKKSKRRD